MYYYSNEIVFRGHPDKVCDQISDALLDAYMEQDPYSRCGIEVAGGKNKIFVTGEVSSRGKVDVDTVVKSVLHDVGYRTSYEIINNIGLQSNDIALGVDVGGAGDQGMMFGYACGDTPQLLPTAMVILQKLAKYYDLLRKVDERFLPDGKAQITGAYSDDGKLLYIKDFTISYQNTEVSRRETDTILVNYVTNLCESFGIHKIEQFHINPTGKFLLGGFDADAGLTGRKIVVDNYQSFCRVGGGAFSGKDPTKVDRSAAYIARQLAIKAMKTACPEVRWCEIQLSYAIGLDKPLGIYARTNKGWLTIDPDMFDYCTPNAIIDNLKLREVKYYQTARFGHFGDIAFPWEK